MNYDLIIIGAGLGGISVAYELMQKKSELKVAVFEAGHALHQRRCPVDGDKVRTFCMKPKGTVVSENTNSLFHASASGVHVARNIAG